MSKASILATILVVALSGCHGKGGGGGGGKEVHVIYQGRPMVTSGNIVTARKANMVVVGKTNDGRDVYKLGGGGGGGAPQSATPIFLEIGPNTFRILQIEKR